MILHIPHASTVIPPDTRSSIVLDDLALATELLIMTDHYTDDLFGTSGDRIIAEVSRLVVDVERFDDDAIESMAKKGMGAVYTKTSNLDKLRNMPSNAERQQLLDKHCYPHHSLLEEAVQNELDAEERALIIDCHSFPSQPLSYEEHQGSARPDFCIGTDSFHTPEDLAELICDYFRDNGYTVALNTPFSGSMVPAAFYKDNENVWSVMIEVNRSLYMDEQTGQKTSEYDEIKSCLENIVYLLEHYKQYEGNMFEFLRNNGDLLVCHEWDSGGPGAGAGRTDLYRCMGRYYTLVDDILIEHSSRQDALINSDVFGENEATKNICFYEDIEEEREELLKKHS